jgi:thiamine biosynthesis lipoprotein
MIRSIEFRAMNTTVMLAAEGEQAIEGMQATKAFIDECEQRFSRFLPASEMTALNRSAGEWTPVSADLMEMLLLAMKYHEDTNGIFDPTILRNLKRVGYDKSMDEIRTDGVDNSHASRQTLGSPFREVRFDPRDRTVCLPRGMEIDLAGVAKAWIVERAANLLHEYAPVCGVSAGGDILFLGQPSDGMDWDVILEDPRNSMDVIAQLHIPSGAVATSSIMKRSWMQGHVVRHHLIDPRTSEPAQTSWLSATVICSNIIDADVYAKMLLIDGAYAAERLLQIDPQAAWIAVDATANLIGSSNYKEFMYEPATDLFISTRVA